MEGRCHFTRVSTVLSKRPSSSVLWTLSVHVSCIYFYTIFKWENTFYSRCIKVDLFSVNLCMFILLFYLSLKDAESRCFGTFVGRGTWVFLQLVWQMMEDYLKISRFRSWRSQLANQQVLGDLIPLTILSSSGLWMNVCLLCIGRLWLTRRYYDPNSWKPQKTLPTSDIS